jgi:hypothetical protein
VGKPEGKRPFGRPIRRWEGNIKMDLQEMGWGMDWVDLAPERDTFQCGNEPLGSMICGGFLN